MRFRRRWIAIAALIAAAVPTQALARLTIIVDKSTQHMTVELNDRVLYDWPVSTGQHGYDTPSGNFKPFRMERDHFSREWDDAPMPNSIFFTQRGHAIHGTTHLKAIGRPASHGCVRLELQNAAKLFELVRQEGMANTRVELVGDTPSALSPAYAGEPQRGRNARGYEDDVDFTGALQQRGRPEYLDGPAFYDGRYYYDRRGRRYTGRVYRDWRYDNDDPRFSPYGPYRN